MHLVYFETSATRYSVAAARLEGKPNLLLYCFGFCGMPMSAALASVDSEPNSFADFCEQWGRNELSETDCWVGFLVLRHLLNYPVAFEQLRPFLQREALKYTVEHLYDRDEDSQPSKIEQVPYLARELDSWPADWEQQLQPIREEIGLAISLR